MGGSPVFLCSRPGLLRLVLPSAGKLSLSSVGSTLPIATAVNTDCMRGILPCLVVSTRTIMRQIEYPFASHEDVGLLRTSLQNCSISPRIFPVRAQGRLV